MIYINVYINYLCEYHSENKALQKISLFMRIFYYAISYNLMFYHIS